MIAEPRMLADSSTAPSLVVYLWDPLNLSNISDKCDLQVSIIHQSCYVPQRMLAKTLADLSR